MGNHLLTPIDPSSVDDPSEALQEPLPAPMCGAHGVEMEFFDMDAQIPVCAHCTLKGGPRYLLS